MSDIKICDRHGYPLGSFSMGCPYCKIEQLTAERDELKEIRDKKELEINKLYANVKMLLDESDKYRKALEQYADLENWGYTDTSGCPKGHGRYTDACFLVQKLLPMR